MGPGETWEGREGWGEERFLCDQRIQQRVCAHVCVCVHVLGVVTWCSQRERGQHQALGTGTPELGNITP